MLQSANRDKAQENQANPAIGSQVRQSARRLHDALQRMEAAVEKLGDRPAPAPTTVTVADPAVTEENRTLKAALQEQQKRNQQVAGRVDEVSKRLDGLLARLAKTLQA